MEMLKYDIKMVNGWLIKMETFDTFVFLHMLLTTYIMTVNFRSQMFWHHYIFNEFCGAHVKML